MGGKEDGVSQPHSTDRPAALLALPASLPHLSNHRPGPALPCPRSCPPLPSLLPSLPAVDTIFPLPSPPLFTSPLCSQRATLLSLPSPPHPHSIRASPSACAPSEPTRTAQRPPPLSLSPPLSAASMGRGGAQLGKAIKGKAKERRRERGALGGAGEVEGPVVRLARGVVWVCWM